MSAVIAHAAASGHTAVKSLQYVKRSSAQKVTQEPVGIPIKIDARAMLESNVRSSLIASERKANWGKYAIAIGLGVVGLAAFIMGFVLGYSWVLIVVGAVIVVTSLYGIKHTEDEVKQAGLKYDSFVDREDDVSLRNPRFHAGMSLFDI